MYKLHKSQECITANDSYLIKQIVIDQSKQSKACVDNVHKSPKQIRKEAEDEATEIIKNAQSDAEKIILKAKEQADELIERIKNEAYNDGYNKGKRQGLEDIEITVNQAKDILNEMQEQKCKIISDLQPKIVGLAIKISQRIIGQQLNVEKDKFISLITKAVKKASGKEITIFVHPNQYENINDIRHQLISHANQIKSIDIIKKELLDEFDCLIETQSGIIDAGVNSQLKKVEEAFDLNESYL